SPRTAYRYDKVGNLLSTTLSQHVSGGGTWPAAGVSVWRTDYRYDALKRRDSEQHFDIDGQTELSISRAQYDEAGNVSLAIDPRDNSTRFAYDTRNRMTSSTN